MCNFSATTLTPTHELTLGVVAWNTRGQYLKVVIGAEASFPGLELIQRNFNSALDCEFPIYYTLTETVQAAIVLATK